MKEEDSNIILNIRKSDKESFDRLKEDDVIFSKCDNKELFLMAMAIGFNEGKSIEIKSGERVSGGYTRVSYLSDREKVLIKAIAIAEMNSFNVMLDEKEIYSIAETYAAGGIESLKQAALAGNPDDYLKKMEITLLEILETVKNDESKTE